MSNYTKTTNFATKDNLVSGDANKIVKGTEIDTEFNNISTAVATKANLASPAFTGVISIPDGAAGAPTLTNDGDTNSGLYFSAEGTMAFTANGTAQFTIADGAITPVSNNDIDLGTSSLQFKNAFFDGTVTTDLLVADTSLAIAGSTTVTGILDEDNLASDSNVKLATQQSIKAYVDASVTAQDLDLTDGTTAISIDLDSETLSILGGTGITSTASGNGVTVALDSSVSTNTGTQTLTNKTLTTPILTPTASAAGSIVFKEGTNNGTNAVTLIGPASTADVTLTLPAATDTLVGKATTDTLTNKTLAAPTFTGTTVVASLDISGDVDVDGTLETDALSIAGTTVTSTAAELNILDGVTSTATELNLLDGVTSTTAELNILDGVTSTASELNILDGVTSTTAELNILDGVTSTTAELNILDGVTSTAAEINLLDGSSAGAVVNSKAVIYSADGDITVGDNLALTSDASVISFGANSEVTLTHVHDAGLLLNGAMALYFSDGSQFINAPSATVLDITATDEIELNATAIDVNGTMDVSGAFTNGSTLVSTGKITADAGIDIDNINIDGTTIALSSGDLTLDVAGDIILDPDGADIIFKDGGTQIGRIRNVSSGEFTFQADVLDKDIIFNGNDGGSTITALALDMSAAGAATFNSTVTATGSTTGGSGAVDTLTIKNTGTSAGDGPRIQFTSGTSTSGAAIASGGVALNSADLVFYAGGNTKRMRIAADGNFIVGNGGAWAAGADVCMIEASGLIDISRNDTGAQNAIAFYNPNGGVGQIRVSGSSVAYNTSSDYRLKENVVAITGATERLKQLNPSRFNFIADADTTVDGFLAHEVQDVVPEAITGTKDAMRDEEYEVTPAVLDDDGNVTTEAVMGTRSVPDYQGIDQSKLVPLLVATIQELEARLTALENN